MTANPGTGLSSVPPGPFDRTLRFFLEHKLVVVLVVMAIFVTGAIVSPFDPQIAGLFRDPVPVDALPDIGENQQIVFTRWAGRSPQDIEDQVSYPLTVALLGIPGVKTIRSNSVFGFSSIFVLFDEDTEFYWSRSRVLEKLSSLAPGTLPEGVRPTLGPDATALGQVLWYTLEGRDSTGNTTGGWSLEELRTVQDWTVRYALASAKGVSEVASVGGFVREYQVDVDPDAMRAHGVTLDQVYAAVKSSNVDVGARTLEVNRVEYIVRGIGFLSNVDDIRRSVVTTRGGVPIFVENVAQVSLGPAPRRGVLDKSGTEAVGGVVVARFGGNPLATIEAVKAKILEIGVGLPEKTLADGTVSKVTVVPFYDRSGLIHETLTTLETALTEEIFVTMLVLLAALWHFRSALLISVLLPLAVLLCFVAMRLAGVEANVVALSGIAIAIGTMVDMGIVLAENILSSLEDADKDEDRLEVIHGATMEVAGAVVTAVATTVIGFLPVFTMEAAEGKLFRPLAFTKTFALLASVLISLFVLPAAAHVLLRGGRGSGSGRLSRLVELVAPYGNALAIVAVTFGLTHHWMPLGPAAGVTANLLFVITLFGGTLGSFRLFYWAYPRLLAFFLRHKLLFLLLPLGLIVAGFAAWRDLGQEFMPPLDEGSYLYMPTTMAHASIAEAQEVLSLLDRALSSVPEVEEVVGKLGRADSPLDPAPISMIETMVRYRPEFRLGANGELGRFQVDSEGAFLRDVHGTLIPDPTGQPFRNWRDHIRAPDDIWAELVKVGEIPGLTSAPRLQPIAARLVMLQSGMRAPMGVKIKGPDLATIEAFALELERWLKQVPSVLPAAVFADRIVGKPYLEVEIDREAIARYGIPVRRVQDVLEIAVGGQSVTYTVEGRARYAVRVRYMRELRDSPEALERILVAGPEGAPIPLAQLARIRYVRGPQVIKSEDTSLLGYVLFDKRSGHAEVDVVEESQAFLQARIEAGELVVPTGVSYRFAGAYENQIRSAARLRIVLPLALGLIFLVLYLHFGSALTTGLVFTGVLVAWAGGFLMLWLYNQPWFFDATLQGIELRSLFQIHDVNLSVATWVGFLALFGIATDDGVVVATYLEQRFATDAPATIEAVRAATLEAGCRRIRPCLMTTATTLLALIPVLMSRGRGADIMIPMAIPSFGGMAVELVTLFVVPVLYCLFKEWELPRQP